MRYTESRLTKYGNELLQDIDKDVVNMVDNYSASEKEPHVLPGLILNLLCNGSSGIAVGMATNIPPHNINDIYDSLIFIINKTLNGESYTIDELINIIKGPDFPTGGYISGKKGLEDMYKTGRGTITVYSKYHIKDNKIIITEIPYNMEKTALVQNIADKITNKVIEDIKEIRDESDKKGISIVIEVKKNGNINLVEKQLLKYTKIKNNFSGNFIVIKDEKPELVNIKQILESFIDYSANIITKKTKYELKKITNKLSMLQAEETLIENEELQEKVIKIIKTSNKYKKDIMNLGFDEYQTNHILDLKLSKLSNVYLLTLKEEKKIIKEKIEEYNKILTDGLYLLQVIKKAYEEKKIKFGDKRRTEFIDFSTDFNKKDTMKEEDIVITLTQDNCIKAVLQQEYKTQNRGGKGVKAFQDNEIVKSMISISNKDQILLFTNRGKYITLEAIDLPIVNRTSKSKSLNNYIKLDEDEYIIAILPDIKEDETLLFVTKYGMIKKLNKNAMPKMNNSKIINFKDQDILISVIAIKNEDEVILTTALGRGLRIDLTDIRPSGRTAMGVKGMKLKKDDYIIDATKIIPDTFMVLVTKNGFGKKQGFDLFNTKNRGGLGTKVMNISEKTGKIIAVVNAKDDDELLMATETQINRITVKDVAERTNRATGGVKLINLNEDDKLKAISVIENEKENEVEE